MSQLSRKPQASTAQTLWSTYWSSDRSVPSRNALIEHYLPIVRLAASRLASRNGRRAQSADIDDLLQHGIFGLRDAIRGFDPSRGVKFETFAAQRIRGAMLDGLKLHHWVPRDLRKRINQYVAARDQAMTEEGSRLNHEALAARIGVCPESIHDLEIAAGRMQFGSLHIDSDTQAADVPADHLEDTREEIPDITAQRQDVRDLFLRELTRAERHLIMLYYYDELTMREIGAVLGISGTRVSQIHTDIVTRLRSRLAARVHDPRGNPRPSLEL